MSQRITVDIESIEQEFIDVSTPGGAPCFIPANSPVIEYRATVRTSTIKGKTRLTAQELGAYRVFLERVADRILDDLGIDQSAAS